MVITTLHRLQCALYLRSLKVAQLLLECLGFSQSADACDPRCLLLGAPWAIAPLSLVVPFPGVTVVVLSLRFFLFTLLLST